MVILEVGVNVRFEKSRKVAMSGMFIDENFYDQIHYSQILKI